MTPRRDLLGEAVDPSTHNYDALLVRIDHERPPFLGKAVRRGCGEWPGAESNCRHADFQSAALPTELPGRAAETTQHTTTSTSGPVRPTTDERPLWDKQWDSILTQSEREA